MGKIFYLMGKSASGKDTLYKRLLEECPQLRPILLYTTRPMRDGENQGVEYYFITEEELEEFVQKGKVIERRIYQTAVGLWAYATVDDGRIGRGKEDDLAIGTLESFEKMRKYFGKIVVPIYITVENGIRLERALKRERQQKEPNYVEMCRRFIADEEDFSEENLKRFGIFEEYENEDLDLCAKKIRKKIDDIGNGFFYTDI